MYAVAICPRCFPGRTGSKAQYTARVKKAEQSLPNPAMQFSKTCNVLLKVGFRYASCQNNRSHWKDSRSIKNLILSRHLWRLIAYTTKSQNAYAIHFGWILRVRSWQAREPKGQQSEEIHSDAPAPKQPGPWDNCRARRASTRANTRGGSKRRQ
eukprot:4992866-Amphidinium_carterae.1